MVYRQNARSVRVREASRARMLAAARRHFVRHGFAAATMRDIARGARTSIGNLYFYFGSKEELLEALLAEARDALWDWTDRAAARVPPGPGRLALVLYANVTSLVAADRDLTRMLLRESGRPELADRITGRYVERIRRYLEDNFPGYPAERLDWAATAWVGAGRTCLDRWFAGEMAGDPPQLAAFLARWNLRGLGVPDLEIDEALARAAAIVAELRLPAPSS
jgi:AcrR family transcriptional regulator